MEIRRVNEYVWEIPREGGMRVPGRIFASEHLMESIRGDIVARQVANVAHLRGIVGYSWAMPDAHMGYGFPIGGVAATEFNDEGVVSPGGVGYDINCGVRMLAVDLKREDIEPRIDKIVEYLFKTVPCGADPHESGMGHLSAGELRQVLAGGARFAVERGFGRGQDLEHTEDKGCLEDADPGAVSERAVERGRRQLGSLGSGNHFFEVGYVEEVFSRTAAGACVL